MKITQDEMNPLLVSLEFKGNLANDQLFVKSKFLKSFWSHFNRCIAHQAASISLPEKMQLVLANIPLGAVYKPIKTVYFNWYGERYKDMPIGVDLVACIKLSAEMGKDFMPDFGYTIENPEQYVFPKPITSVDFCNTAI